MICNLSLQYYLHNCTIQVLNCSWQRRLSELVSRNRVRFLHSGHLFCKWHCYIWKMLLHFIKIALLTPLSFLVFSIKRVKCNASATTEPKKKQQAHREILTQWGHERNLSSLTLYKCYESNICNLCSESLLQTESLTKDHLSLYIAWRFNFLPWLIFAHVIKKSFIDRSDFSYRMNFLSVHLFVVHFMDYLVQ